MRTTIEISPEQHRVLNDLATRRGVRGFSGIVQEAIDLYLQSLAGDDLEAALALEGSLSDEDAAQLRARIDEAWQTWRSAS